MTKLNRVARTMLMTTRGRIVLQRRNPINIVRTEMRNVAWAKGVVLLKSTTIATKGTV